METISLQVLAWLLAGLIFVSAFFSASETGMMSLNRYRLKHLSKTSKSAKQASYLLTRPDRLLGVILLGNNFANILASALTTIIAVRLIGNLGILIASILLTIIILIFAEVSPKTVAALYPEKVAFPAAFILRGLLWIFYPLVWLVNFLSNGLLKAFGINVAHNKPSPLSREELRTLVHETAGHIPSQHRSMLLSILDLEKVSVEDIMVPRSEVIGIDLDNEWDTIVGQLANIQHTFLPVYQQNLDEILGVLHLRNAMNLMASDEFDLAALKDSLEAAYFVPESTPLTTQLLNFQKNKRRLGLVVNEYGDIQGLISLEDILEEIVGEFTTDMATASQDVHPQEDGSYLIDGSATIRDLNKSLEWHLPMKGPKTLSGLIIDHLQMIPEVGTCCLIHDLIIEVVQVSENTVKTAKVIRRRSVLPSTND